ncbi:hypothetical protein FJ651_07250 [Paucihalobacter ruber]|uniref:DUF4129 domain-containing protein n=1 Tax=Paucihalobacter ruber TaxID=2567861 RepID=A0A506PLF8_9FLAO|nr:hypothetical protein [Paucihalobacter ruber]TPV33947.1 hypothetical protein FJ651_07250 [Paucihalobacter ruber]
MIKTVFDLIFKGRSYSTHVVKTHLNRGVNTDLDIKLNTGLVDSLTQNKIKTDSSQVEVTPFKEAINERYKGSDFNYDINDTGGINLLQRLLQRFFNWLSDVFGINIDFVDYKTLEIIIYALLGIGALYLLIRFLVENPMNRVFKTEETSIETFNYTEENITEVNFDQLINQAINEGNFRLATRFLYLKSLKILSKNNIIEWHFDKTNSDYLNEIKNTETQQLFKKVSYVYDYVWYGEFTVNHDQFEYNKQYFVQLQKAKN